MELRKIDKPLEGEQTNGFSEKIYNPMSGYMGSYDYCRFEGEVLKLKNGKYVVQVTETVFHGDEEDEGLERSGDISDEDIYVSNEVDTEEEADAMLDEYELEYEGETDLA